MFIPAYIVDKQQPKEKRLEIEDYSKQYYDFIEKKQKQEENSKKETVIHIQIY